MELFLKDISFHGVMLDTLFGSSVNIKHALQLLIQDHINLGAIKPLVRTVFECDQIEQGFRYMAVGKHIGKVLIRLRSEEEKLVFKTVPITQMSIPKVLFDENSSCIICGDYNKSYK